MTLHQFPSRGLIRRGFTLVEVLATMVLMGIVLPVAMRGISVALAAASNARHVREATSLAQIKLQELTAPSATGGNQSGDFGEENPDYRWTSQIASRDYGIEQLDLRVTWQDRGQERGLTISTLIYPDAYTGSTSSSGSSSTSSGGTTP